MLGLWCCKPVGFVIDRSMSSLSTQIRVLETRLASMEVKPGRLQHLLDQLAADSQTSFRCGTSSGGIKTPTRFGFSKPWRTPDSVGRIGGGVVYTVYKGQTQFLYFCQY